MRITDYLLVIPDLAFAMVIADVWGPSLSHVIGVIAILEWATTARIIRAQVMSVKERVYIKRARSIGASHARIIARHILPQVGPLLMANTVLTVAVAIYLETALAFLGLEDPSTTTWGTILEHAFDRAAVSAGRMVGDRPRWNSYHPAHHGVLPARPGHRGCAQPAAEGRAPVLAALGAQAAGRPRTRCDMSGSSLLEVRDLHVWFTLPGGGELHAVQGVGFELGAGERFGLVGESGCGKTTSILAMMGLLPPNASVAGEVRLAGH